MIEQKNIVDELFAAIEINDPDEILKLISRGAVNQDNDNSDVPVLHRMMKQYPYLEDRETIVNSLIENNAKIDFVDCEYATLIHAAVYRNLLSTTKLLVDKGVESLLEDGALKNILISAHNEEMVEFLVGCGLGSIDEVDETKNTLLHNAVNLESNLDYIKYLLQHIDVNARDYAGRTALDTLLTNAYNPKLIPTIIDLLLEHGADVNSRSNAGMTAFYHANSCERLGSAVLVQLLNAGADINGKDKQGKQAIHYSAGWGLEDVTFLVENGSDLNVAGLDDGETPLIVAVKNWRLDVVKYLLDKGAETNIRDATGRTALNYALENNGDYDDDDIRNILNVLEKYNAVATSEDEIQH